MIQNRKSGLELKAKQDEALLTAARLSDPRRLGAIGSSRRLAAMACLHTSQVSGRVQQPALQLPWDDRSQACCQKWQQYVDWQVRLSCNCGDGDRAAFLHATNAAPLSHRLALPVAAPAPCCLSILWGY